ncbi:MAG: PstC family ABC transporter permease, partial [Actinomycetota bacterium]
MAAAGTTLLGRRRRPGEALVRLLLLGCGIVSVATTAGILLSLAFEAWEFFKDVSPIDFLTGTRWAPTFSNPGFGVLPLVSATLLITAIGAAVALPVGLGIAIFLSEYARPRVRKIIKPTLEILAGIPTVVFGYFALTFVTPAILQPLVPGMESRIFNALSAGLVVGIAIIPLVASISEDAMRAVP